MPAPKAECATVADRARRGVSLGAMMRRERGAESIAGAWAVTRPPRHEQLRASGSWHSGARTEPGVRAQRPGGAAWQHLVATTEGPMPTSAWEARCESVRRHALFIARCRPSERRHPSAPPATLPVPKCDARSLRAEARAGAVFSAQSVDDRMWIKKKIYVIFYWLRVQKQASHR